MNPFFPGPPPGFPAPPPGPPFGFPPSAQPFGFPPSAPPFGCPPQAPPPCMNAKTRYIYRTRDGGPPDMGKPPSGPPAPPFGFPGFPPGPPPPGFCFGGPPPSAPPPGAWAFQPPPAPPAAPSHMCFQNASGTTCVPTSTTTKTTTTSAPFDPATYKGPVCRTGTSSAPSAGLAPGNRVNERIVKADDGSGVLLSPDQTCFHVLEPGQSFGPHTSTSQLVRDKSYKVQYADSDWPVDKVIELLGGKNVERIGSKFQGHPDLIGIQEWVPTTGEYFRSGETIMLLDARAKQTLRQVGWGPERGRAGQKPPVWVMLWPVKED